MPVEGVTLTKHCAGVNCWFVSWYNGGYELYALYEFLRTLYSINYDALQNYKACCLLNVAIPPIHFTFHYISDSCVSFPSTHTLSLPISLPIPIYYKPLTKLSRLVSFTPQTLWLCPHCSYYISQSFNSTEFWDFLV